MALKFDLNGQFADHLLALLTEVKDPAVQALLHKHIQSIIILAESNTQANREQILEDLNHLIAERVLKEVGQ